MERKKLSSGIGKIVESLAEDALVRRLVRILIVALAAWIFFGFFCRPLVLSGESMMPTYPKRGFLFCWRPSYWFSLPERGDIVVISVAGNRVSILKRVLAFEGETVECRNGVFFVNGKELDEPYVKLRSGRWNMAPFQVAPGHLFVMGDNREMPQHLHKGGEVAIRRLYGKPVLSF